MIFTVYPTKKDATLRQNGRERTGQLLSPAPGGIWIIPTPREDGDPTALFGHQGLGRTYVIETEKTGP